MSSGSELLLRIGDTALGWLLYLPRDLRLLALALLTALLLAVVKRAVTDTEWSLQAQSDLKKLKGLIRKKRKEHDKAGLERYRYTRALIQMSKLKGELKTLALVILPLMLIGFWSWHRMEFVPPTEGDSFEVVLRTPASAVGKVAYLVPSDAIDCQVWVRQVVSSGSSTYPGVASWSVVPSSDSGMKSLVIRLEGNSFEQPVLIGGRHYQVPQFTSHGVGWRTQISMKEVKLFGLVPGLRSAGLPPWVSAYVLLVIVLLPISRRCFGSHK